MTATPARRLSVALWIGGVAAAGLAVVGAPWPPPLDLALLAHFTGLLAGYLIAIMVVLMARVPVLEHRIGPEVLARWHVRGGRAVLALMLAHGAAAVQVWTDSRRQDLFTAAVQVLGLPGLSAAAAGTALFVAIGVVSIRVARRKLSYERWHGIHLMTYVALALSFFHELAGPNLAGQPVIQVAWSLLYTGPQVPRRRIHEEVFAF